MQRDDEQRSRSLAVSTTKEELCMDTLQSMWSTWSSQSHIYQADYICDQLNEATSTFHAHGLPSDPDHSLLLLHWPGMNYQLTSATSRQLLHSRNASRHYCLMLPMAPHSCDTPILYFTSHFIIRPIYFVKRSRPLLQGAL